MNRSSFDPTRDYDQEAKDARIAAPTSQQTSQHLPEVILARWNDEDWDDRTMTAIRYRYIDYETGDYVDLTDSEAEMYSWGTCHDDTTGGSQVGWLRP